MHIEIDYNGSIANCKLTGCLPTASYPDVNPERVYDFKDADPMSKAIAIKAFHTIIKHYRNEIYYRKR